MDKNDLWINKLKIHTEQHLVYATFEINGIEIMLPLLGFKDYQADVFNAERLYPADASMEFIDDFCNVLTDLLIFYYQNEKNAYEFNSFYRFKREIERAMRRDEVNLNDYKKRIKTAYKIFI